MAQGAWRKIEFIVESKAFAKLVLRPKGVSMGTLRARLCMFWQKLVIVLGRILLKQNGHNISLMSPIVDRNAVGEGEVESVGKAVLRSAFEGRFRA